MNHPIAQQIRNQLGHKALYMLGAQNLAASEQSLSFKIRGSHKFNHVQITLNNKDLYDVYFVKFRAGKILNHGIVNDVYCDMLHSIIEEHTGLRTTLY